jgi:hypothetical protein
VRRWGWVVAALPTGLRQRGGGDFTGQFWLGRASTGLVCLCHYVRSVTAKVVEVVPARAATVLLLPLTRCPFPFL